MLKLIVFDCDGVLFDSRNANKQYYNHLLHHFNNPPMSEEELDFVHMHSAPDSVRHIFRHYSNNSFTEIDNYRKALGYERFLPFMKMEDDLLDFLHQVQGNYHLAISTNRGNTMLPLLKMFKLDDYFGKVVTSETARRPKPAPDGLLEILKHFQCSPEESIFIGDSVIDKEHAEACNVPLISFKNPEMKANFHVNSFMEALSLAPFVDKNM